MKHLWALLIKFTSVTIVLFSILSIFNIGVGTILFISIVTTVVAYALGDLYILPKMGTIAAIVVDFGLTFGLVWILCELFVTTPMNTLSASLFCALAITAVEVFFHFYVRNHILSNNADSFIPAVTKYDSLTTEFSKEISPVNNKNNSRDGNKNIQKQRSDMEDKK
ncbi:YndM family protein [Mesobacillus foraminis]|uniref:YndM family protein n=1 Tax=Mesobacillus foraminis TaxID=279826 RepID=UPI0013CE53B7|nr:YndM family protein [Mesobacillus foraminis]